jgi:hypothetical protein
MMKPTFLTTLIVMALSTPLTTVNADPLKQDKGLKPSTTIKQSNSKLIQNKTTIPQNQQLFPKVETLKNLPGKVNTPQMIKPRQMSRPTPSNQKQRSQQPPATSSNRPQAGFIKPATQGSAVFIHPSKTERSQTGPASQPTNIAPGSSAGNTIPNKPASSPSGFYGKVTTSTSTTGEATFTLPNGQQTPQRGPDGTMGVPDDKGGVLYADGTYVLGAIKGKDSTIFHPDGSSSTVARPGGSSIQNPSNNAGPANQSSAGSTATGVIPNKPASSPGGFYGKVTTSTSTTGVGTFTLPNGQQTPQRGPDGTMGMPDDKGGVLYGDGTYVSGGRKGEDTIVYNPDGTVRSSTPTPGSSSNNDNSSSTNSSSNDSSDDDNNEDDNNEDDNSGDSNSDDSSSDDSNDNDDSNEDTTDSGEGDTGGTEEDVDDEAAEGQTGHEMGTDPTRQYHSAGKDYVDGKTQPGQQEPDSIAPGDCEDSGGGQVMDQLTPDNCGPAIRGSSDDDDGQPEAPNAADSLWQAPTGTTGPDSVIQPGIADEAGEEGLAPLERLQNDLDSITNPGNR